MMKTIEEQAREYAEDIETYMSVWDGPKPTFEVLIEKAFLEGAKVATRWIPVEEEPIDKGNILIALDYRGGVHTMFWGAIAGHNRIIQNDRHDHTFKYYTHWLPVPPMPEK